MATVLNERQKVLDNTTPRTIVTGVTVSGTTATFIKPKNLVTLTPGSVTLTATIGGYTTATYNWSYAVSTAPATWTAISGNTSGIVVSNSTFATDVGTAGAITYRCIVTQPYFATSTGTFSVSYVQEGSDGSSGANAVIVDLLSESDVVTANTDGTGYSLPVGGTNSLRLYSGGSQITNAVTYNVSSPTVVSGLTAAINASGAITLSGNTPAWTTDNASFTFNAITNSVTYSAVYSIAKSKQGAAGANAIIVDLLSEADVVSANTNGAGYNLPAPGSNSLRLYSGGTQLTSGVTYNVSSPTSVGGLTAAINASGAITLSGSTPTWTTDSASFTFNAITNTVTYSAVYSIAKSKQGIAGTNAVIVDLLSESDVVTANSDGSGYSLPVGGSNNLKLYSGGTQLSSGITYNVSSPTVVSGLTAAIDASGAITLSGNTPVWTTDNASFTFNAITNSVTYSAVYSIAKSKQGVAGSGADAVLADLVAENHVVSALTDGTGYGTLPSNTFRLYSGGSQITAGVTYSVSSPTSVSGLTASIDANGAITLSGTNWTSDTANFTFNGITATNTYSSSYSIAKSKQGSQGNPGNNGNRVGFLEVYKWAAAQPSTNFPTGTSVYTWSTGTFTAPSTANSWANPASGTPTKGDTLWAVSTIVSDTNTSTTSIATWPANPTPYAVGYSGTDGTAGPAGSRTAVLDLYQWGTSQPSAPTGTSTYTWSSATFTLPAGAGSWTLTPGAPPVNNTLYVARRVFVDSTTTSASLVDWGTVSILTVSRSGSNGSNGTNGLDGLSVSVTRPSVTLPSSDGGIVSSYTNSGTDIRVFEGNTALTYVSSNPTAGQFTVGTVTQSPTNSITVNTFTGANSTTLTVPNHSAMAQTTDSVVLTYPLTIIRTNTTTVTFNVSQSITKAKAGLAVNGTDGGVATFAYAITSASSLPGSPTISAGHVPTAAVAIASSGAANWYSTPASSLSAGQWMFQVAGVRNTNGTYTWTNPGYLSTFRVGTLSALGVSTGALSVDNTLTIGSTGKIISDGTAFGGTGIFLGYDVSAYKFSVGTPGSLLSWNGTTLSVPGGTITGTIPNGAIASSAITVDKLNVAIGGGNLITNSGFEADSNTDGLADSWVAFVGGSGEPTRVQNTTRTAGMNGLIGSFAQRLTIVSLTNASLDSGIYNTVNIPVMPLTKYTLSGWFRSNIANQVYIAVRQYDSGNASLTDNATPVLSVINTWTRLSVTFTTNSNVSYLSPMIRGLTSVGWFEADGVQLELGDVLTAYTPRPQEINPGTIGTTQIADDAITTQKILAGQITAAKIATTSISADNIAAGAITASKISVTSLSAISGNMGSLTVDNTLSMGASGVIKTSGINYGGDGIYISTNSFSVGSGNNKIGFSGGTLTIPAASIGGTIAATVTPPSNWDNANVLVGGTNLVPGASTGTGWTFNLRTGTEFTKVAASTGETDYIHSAYFSMWGDQQITISFDAREDSIINSRDFYILPDDYQTAGLLSSTFPKSTTYVRRTFTFTTPTGWGTQASPKSVRVRFDHNGSAGGVSATIYVRNVKLELGNKATDWSPPPVDVDANITTAATTASWTSVSSRPTELTDGRVSAGLDSSGDVNRDFTTTRLNSSNVLRRTGGGAYAGDLSATKNIFTSGTLASRPTGSDGDLHFATDNNLLYQKIAGVWVQSANNYTNTNQLTDGAGLGTTAVWTSVSSRPTELTDGRVSAGLDNNGDLNRDLQATRLNTSNVLRRNTGGVYLGELDATKGAPAGTNVGSVAATSVANASNGYLGQVKSITLGGVQTSFYPVYIQADATTMTGSGYYDVVVFRDHVHQDSSWLSSYTCHIWARASGYGNAPGAIIEVDQVTGAGTYNYGVAAVNTNSVGTGIWVLLRGGMTHKISVSQPIGPYGVYTYTTNQSEANGNAINIITDGTASQLYPYLNKAYCPSAPIDFAASVGGAEKPANNATVGATWGTDVANRPTELTDGRVSAGLDNNGDLNRDLQATRLNTSNVLRRNTGGVYTGALDANNTTNTNQLVDGAGLGTTAVWANVSGAGKPADYATNGKSLAIPLTSWNLGSQSIVTISDGKVGTKALRLTGGNGYPNMGPYIPIDRSKVYRTRFWARPSSNNTSGLLYFTLQQFTNDAGTTGPVNGGRSPYKPSGQSRASHNALFGTDAWGEYSYIWTKEDWQAGVTHVRPDFLDNYSNQAGYWEVQDFTWEEVTEANSGQSLTYSIMGSVQAIGNTIFKSAGNQSWDSKAYSVYGYRHGCYVQFSPDQDNAQFMIGMNSDPTTGADWSYLDYAWYCATGNYADVRVSGTAPTSTTYNKGDTFTITNDSASVRWYKNGSLIWTVTLPASIAVGSLPTMYFDSSFANVGASASKIQFGPITSLRLNSDSPMLMDAPNGGRIRIFDNGGNLRVTLGYLGT